MTILSYTLLAIGILILLIVASFIIFLLFLMYLSRSKKIVFLDEIAPISLEKYRVPGNIIESFLSTDWKIYTDIFNITPPEELVAFYKNKGLISLHNFMIKLNDLNSSSGYQLWEIGKFILPQNGISQPESALAQGEIAKIPDAIFCFAEDLSGNVYYIIPSTEKQNKVFYYDIGSNVSSEVALLNDFLNKSRFCFEL